MAFWRLINRSYFKLSSNRLTRIYFEASLAPSLNHVAKQTGIFSPDNPSLDICRRPTSVFDNPRFFASSAQASMKEVVETNGPRLNEQITAPFVRLVIEEGHCIVSRNEALRRAKQLELDLVEVQRAADPPVCKIMDYKFEKYKRATEEKERAKAKRSEATLRAGVKEVQFTPKIDLRDLKFKANQAMKMMERGYRVKLAAVPDKINKEIELEKLVELLSRFTPLIEDSAVVESGPNVEKKQVFVVVRHAKFGPSKKGGCKKLEDIDIKNAARIPPKEDSAKNDGPEAEKREATWSVSDSRADFDQIFDIVDDSEGPKLDSSRGGGQSKPGFNVNEDQPVGHYNRYAKKEPSRFSAAPAGRDTNRFESRFPNSPLNQQPSQPRFPNQNQNVQPSQPRFPNQNQNVQPSQPRFPNQNRYQQPSQPRFTNQSQYSQPSQPPFPNQNQQPSQPRFPNQSPSQQPTGPRTPGGTVSGYGIFSNQRTNQNN